MSTRNSCTSLDSRKDGQQKSNKHSHHSFDLCIKPTNYPISMPGICHMDDKSGNPDKDAGVVRKGAATFSRVA